MRRQKRLKGREYEVSISQSVSYAHGHVIIRTRRIRIMLWVIGEKIGVRIEFPHGRVVTADGFELERPTKNPGNRDDAWIQSFVVNTVHLMERDENLRQVLIRDLAKGIRQLHGNGE